MKKIFYIAVILSAITGMSSADPSQWNIAYCGQSNAAGRALPGQLIDFTHIPGINMWREGKWQPAQDPTGEDVRYIGVASAFTLCRELKPSLPPEQNLGIISCAKGGTGLWNWGKNGDCYNAALAKIRTQESTTMTLKLIVWLQGEAEATNVTAASNYKAGLKTIIANFREDLGFCPFIMMEIPHQANGEGFNPSTYPGTKIVNQALREISQEVAGTYLVSSDGLTVMPPADDSLQIHYDRNSQVALGERAALIARQVLLQSSVENWQMYE